MRMIKLTFLYVVLLVGGIYVTTITCGLVHMLTYDYLEPHALSKSYVITKEDNFSLDSLLYLNMGVSYKITKDEYGNKDLTMAKTQNTIGYQTHNDTIVFFSLRPSENFRKKCAFQFFNFSLQDEAFFPYDEDLSYSVYRDFFSDIERNVLAHLGDYQKLPPCNVIWREDFYVYPNLFNDSILKNYYIDFVDRMWFCFRNVRERMFGSPYYFPILFPFMFSTSWFIFKFRRKSNPTNNDDNASNDANM